MGKYVPASAAAISGVVQTGLGSRQAAGIRARLDALACLSTAQELLTAHLRIWFRCSLHAQRTARFPNGKATVRPPLLFMRLVLFVYLNSFRAT
eukprot:COSAG02_NODE_8054_length_2729_cov_2.890494_5_plen_94_part_00